MTKQTPFFSIVIPTYNREKLIPATLDSVFSQTFTNYEVIVVDNCSTDNTEEMLKPLVQSGKIKYIRHEKNFERSRSRNTGMLNARGEFLTFLDSDDFLYESCLADAAKFIEKNSDVKCFHNLYELVNDQKEAIYQYDFPSLDDQIKAIVAGNFMSCIGNFIHREIYTKYKFDTYEDLSGAEDWDFWLRVLADNKVSRIEKVNCGILHHENRSTRSNHFESLERGYNYLFEKFRADEHLMKVYGNSMNRIEANSYLYLAIVANTVGSFSDALKFLKIARRRDSSVIFTARFLKIYRRAIFKLQIR